jgi:hypothetical protein
MIVVVWERGREESRPVAAETERKGTKTEEEEGTKGEGGRMIGGGGEGGKCRSGFWRVGFGCESRRACCRSDEGG